MKTSVMTRFISEDVSLTINDFAYIGHFVMYINIRTHTNEAQ